MKRLALAALIASTAMAYEPTQTDIQTALGKAAAKWGMDTDVRVIRLDRLNDCRPGIDAAALSDFGLRSITINSACKWSRKSLLNAITHEYGHMLAGNGTHSPEKRSTMYYRLRRRQRITADNLSYVAMMGGSE